jgi:hypothetical protein
MMVGRTVDYLSTSDRSGRVKRDQSKPAVLHDGWVEALGG